ncbi:MAG TPA: hypothetical protein VGE84_05875 [Allosphingosinicella sp.]
MTHRQPKQRQVLGTVSRSTQGGIRGAVEPFGLYTANIQLD